MVCPIYNELASVFEMRKGCKDIILIDDARLFNGTGGYPDLEELKHFVLDNLKNVKITVKEDVIRIEG